MKALIRKELRENFKWAVLGFIVWTALLLIAAQSYSMLLRNLEPSKLEGLQPLNSVSETAGWFCAILGVLLGWFQIHNETHHELWAFLVHRPVARTTVFLGKVLAGSILYFFAAGIPLLGFITWVAIPGNVAAPFQWSMVLPTAGHLLAGIVYYFAGMLTGLRQARWYASRGLGIGVALLSTGAVLALGGPWDFVSVSFFAALLAIAVWGAFHSDGRYQNQPLPGKIALIGTVAIGIAVVLFSLLTGVVGMLITSGSFSWSSYVMTKDGIVYKQVQRPQSPATIVDLSDNPVKDEKTGRLLNSDEFNRLRANTTWVNVQTAQAYGKYNDAQRRLTYWGESSGTLWYYWNRYGRLVGYNRITRRFIGSLGPNGFASNFSGAGDRFSPPMEHNIWVRSRTLTTPTALYEIDLDDRATKVLFQTSADDPIEASKDQVLQGYDWSAIVATRRFVHLLGADRKLLLKQPYVPFESRPTDIRVYFLEPPAQFALWIAPGFSASVNPQAAAPPTQVTWIGPDQSVTKRTDLPTLGWYNPTPVFWEALMSSLAPSVVVVAIRIFTSEELELRIIFISFATAALLCVPIGWWLARRYNFSRGERLGWAAFLLLSGVPGLLAFLSVHDWPARIPCPNCKNLRPVHLDQCQRCGSEFPAPEKTGIEIFEPLQTVNRV